MTRVGAERAAIQAAAGRLLAGTPLRSTGELTVVQLAIEAGVKRWLLTHKHRDLAQQFQAQARAAGGDPPAVRMLKSKLEALQVETARLRAEKAELQTLVEFYAGVINELTVDHEQLKTDHQQLTAERDSLLGNVRALPTRHPSPRPRGQPSG
jgi:hypothetical protein